MEAYRHALWAILFASHCHLDIWRFGCRVEAFILESEHSAAYLAPRKRHPNLFLFLKKRGPGNSHVCNLVGSNLLVELEHHDMDDAHFGSGD